MSESKLIKKLIIEASKQGDRLFRNNCGAYQDDTGRWIRYGVASPGGSDLIGWRSVIITPGMVGKKIAIFSALEVKMGHTKVTDNQQAFVDTVNKAGGVGIIVRSEDGENFTIERGEGF